MVSSRLLRLLLAKVFFHFHSLSKSPGITIGGPWPLPAPLSFSPDLLSHLDAHCIKQVGYNSSAEGLRAFRAGDVMATIELGPSFTLDLISRCECVVLSGVKRVVEFQSLSIALISSFRCCLCCVFRFASGVNVSDAVLAGSTILINLDMTNQQIESFLQVCTRTFASPAK
jgi:hypothetical protein